MIALGISFDSYEWKVQKFANSFCSLAFSLQEYEKLSAASAPSDEVLFPDLKYLSSSEHSLIKPSTPSTMMDLSIIQNWSDYVANLSTVLCSFLLASELTKQFDVQPSAGRSNMQLQSVYSQLSVKWFVRVLLTVFPCVRACSNQSELPIHLRKFVYIRSI
ncbi:hypothetical protein Leryth_017583 [Lithospermum erythrorhizon]|nr:hypothetical protein Leryth_017583 [Lithospermum erythrorhizon]